MKYRDLVFVLMIVAVGVLWFSGHQSSAGEREPEPATARAEQEATPAVSPTADAIKLIKLTPEAELEGTPKLKLDPDTFSLPKLELTVGQTENLDGLAIKARLSAPEPYSIRKTKDGKPVVRLHCLTNDRSWTFEPKEEETMIESVTSLEWETRLSDLQPPPDIDELRAAYSSSELQWTMSLDEAKEETNVMTRRVVMPVMGGFTTRP